MKYPEDYINKIICGDCLEVMKGIPDKSVDLVLTSPPYDQLRDYKGYSFDFEGIAKEIFRVVKDGGFCVWVVGDSVINGSESGTSFKQALFFKQIGFNLHDTMIYHKNCFSMPPSNRYFQVFEFMFVLSKGKPITFNPIKVRTKYINQCIKHKNSTTRNKDGSTSRNKYLSFKPTRIKENIWFYEVGTGKSSKDKIAFNHPAIFPDALAIDHISSWTNSGDIVLDPFSGSGTTAVQSKKLARNFIGIDIEPKYCEISQKRLSQEYLFT